MSAPGLASRSFVFGAFTLVPERQLLLRGDKAVRIGGRALDLLKALVERPGEVVSKTELLALVWPDTTVDESNLKVNMAALRRVLEVGVDSPPYIATVVGRGYCFVGAVEILGSAPVPLDASSAPANHNLPIASTRVFGRADAIDAIRGDLAEARLVSVIGPGGIGKTTVAVAVAETAVGLFNHGVWLVDLAPLPDPARTADTIAAAFGLQAHAPNMLEILCEFLRDRQTLLVLDNCEHVIEAVAACADRILASAPGVKILATSREPFRIAKERIRKLGGLDEIASVQLFVERANDATGSFRVGEADAPVVAEICRKLDGLALAIELAATRVDAFGISGLSRQLDDRLRFLGGFRSGPERHRTLVAMLDWSYGLLEPHEASLLRAVSAFAGAFTLEGAKAVCADGAIDVLEALTSLATKSLLAVEPHGDGVSCRLLETTRAYASARLRDEALDEEGLVRERHAEWVCALLDRAKVEWTQRSASEWGAVYGPVVDDLRLALGWASDEDGSLFIRLTAAGTLLWNHLSLTQEARAFVVRALGGLEAAELTGTATEMQLQMAVAGATMFTRGLIPEAHAAIARTLAIAERLGDVDYQLRSLRTLGSYQSFAGQYETAVQTHERFLAIAAEHEPAAAPDAETHLGIAELHAGRLESARRRLERLHRQSALGFDDSRLARFMYDRAVDVGNVLSYSQWLTGSPDAAAQTAEATVERALHTKHGLSLSNALSVAACPVFFLSRRYEECERYLAMLEDQVRRHGIVIWSPTARFYRGALACARPDVPPKGIEDLERAVEEFRAINHWARMSWVLAVLADALVRGGRLAEAVTTIEQAREWGHSHSDRWCMPEVMRIHAAILEAEGKDDEAEALLVRSLAVAREIGGRSWELRSGNALAELWLSRSRKEEARELLRPIFSGFTEGFATHDLVVARGLIQSSQ